MNDQRPPPPRGLPGRWLLAGVAAVAVAAGSLGVVFALRNYAMADQSAHTELAATASRSAARADAFLRDRERALVRLAAIAGTPPSPASLRSVGRDRGEIAGLAFVSATGPGRATTPWGAQPSTRVERGLALRAVRLRRAVVGAMERGGRLRLIMAMPPPGAGRTAGAFVGEVVLDGAPLLGAPPDVRLDAAGFTVLGTPQGWTLRAGRADQPTGATMQEAAALTAAPWRAVATQTIAGALGAVRRDMVVRIVVWILLAVGAIAVAVLMGRRLDRLTREQHRARRRLEFLAGTASRLATALSPSEVAEAALADAGLSRGAAVVMSVGSDRGTEVLAWRGGALPAWAAHTGAVVRRQLAAGRVMSDIDVPGVEGPVTAIAFRMAPTEFGAILLWGRPAPRERTVDDVTAQALANQTGEAMRRAVAQEREHDARRRAEVLANLNRVLQDGLTVDARASAALAAVVPQVADFAILEQVLEDGSVRVLASAHRDPGAALAVQHDHGPDALDAACASARRAVLRERRAQAVSIPGRDSMLLLPVRGRAGLNAILLLGATGADGRVLGARDMSLGLALADAIGVALDNVILFQEQQGIALRLQLSLLPGVLEPPPGLGLAVRFDAGSRGLEVGGDWYDVRHLDDGRWGVVVGDVVGRGVEAATVMGRLRFAFQALVGRVHEAGAALSALESFAAAVPGSEMTTVAYAIIDTHALVVHYSCAGHPPPLLVSADGTWRTLDGGREAPLNAFATVRRVSASANLAEGDVLVMYTDGLVERRGASIDEGIQDLGARVAEHVHEDADDIADHVLRGVGAWQDDDLVFLCVKVLPVAAAGTPLATGRQSGESHAPGRNGGRGDQGVVPGIGPAGDRGRVGGQ